MPVFLLKNNNCMIIFQNVYIFQKSVYKERVILQYYKRKKKLPNSKKKGGVLHDAAHKKVFKKIKGRFSIVEIEGIFLGGY